MTFQYSFSADIMANEIDVIEREADADSLPSYHGAYKPEPIVIRGVGQFTICGLSSRFGTEFPTQLTGKLAPEELEETLRRVNFAISRTMHGHGRWLLCGLFFCCCTCGCSLLPTYYLSNRAVSAVRKTLDHENQELYNKLGLHWSLSRRSIEGSGTLVEYVLILDFLPKMPLNMPD